MMKKISTACWRMMRLILWRKHSWKDISELSKVKKTEKIISYDYENDCIISNIDNDIIGLCLGVKRRGGENDS
jgi:hypothetical protein